MNIFIFLAIILTFSLLFGRFLERIRIPWIFASLFLGLFLSTNNLSKEMASSETFLFLSELGVFFLLFMLGLEIDLKKTFRQKKLIVRLSFALTFAESLFGTLFIHYFFDVSWGIAILTALSFATIGEAVLVPILKEFKILGSNFGKIILRVGAMDDAIEIVTIVAVSLTIGVVVGHPGAFLLGNLVLLVLFFFIPVFSKTFGFKHSRLKFKKIPSLFLISLIFLFVFIGIGGFVESAKLGAILAGVALRSFLMRGKILQVESLIRGIAYGFFVPMFFLQVGIQVDAAYVFAVPLLVISVLFITKATKIVVSYFLMKEELGARSAIVLGVGLSAKFSTSIVIVFTLFSYGLIPLNLYSVLIMAMVVSKFIVPVTFATLLKGWKLKFRKVKK